MRFTEKNKEKTPTNPHTVTPIKVIVQSEKCHISKDQIQKKTCKLPHKKDHTKKIKLRNCIQQLPILLLHTSKLTKTSHFQTSNQNT